jgi:hypothetical protein
LVLSAASLAGGYFAAKALLRPVNHSDVTPAGRVLQWLLAAVVGLATLFFLYVGACYRAAWIDGADGTPADIVAKFYSPLHVLVNFDVLALAALGIVGFFVGAFECWRCFNGYRALLRESGIAKAHADSAVREAAEELKASAHRVGIAGEEVLADIEDKSATWMRSVADHCDAANGVAYEVHRRDDLVGSCVESIYAENAEGYQEVRHFERAAPFAFAVADADLEVPDLFVKARQSAIAGASEVSKAVRQAREQIAAHVKAAIVQIDELAGLRPVATDRVLLPKGDNS